MDKINEKIEEKKERKYVKKLTMGVIEDADIPIPELEKLKGSDKTTKSFSIIRKLANAAMIEGEPFTRESSFEEMEELTKFIESFLGQSRLSSAKENLKQKRSPKR